MMNETHLLRIDVSRHGDVLEAQIQTLTVPLHSVYRATSPVGGTRATGMTVQRFTGEPASVRYRRVTVMLFEKVLAWERLSRSA